MKLSITEKPSNSLDHPIVINMRMANNFQISGYPRLIQTPTCKQSLHVHNHSALLRDASRDSAEVSKVLAFSEYEKYNTARLERETDESDEDFDRVVRKLKPLE